VIPIFQIRFIFDTISWITNTNYRPDLVICVVNDGNPEAAKALAIHKFPPFVEILNLPQNRCFAGANNAGWMDLSGKYPSLQYLGTINDDTIPRHLWLDELVKAIQQPQTAVSMPVMETKTGWLKRIKTTATWKLEGSDEMRPDKASINSDTFVSVINGFCFIARRDALEQVGYFDERFCNGCDDIDLSLKLTSQKWRMVVAHKSRVFHFAASSRYLPGTSTNLRRNHELLARKWGGDVERFNLIRPKTIAHCVAFNQEHFMEAWVRNASQYADELLVMYAKVPWTYNKRARESLTPDRTGEILEYLKKEFPRLTVIEGDWKSETNSRNDALSTAKKMGARWLLIVDTDEFYLPEEVFRAYDWMLNNPSEVWRIPHVQFIKKRGWAIVTTEGNPTFQFAIDLSKVRSFKRMRIPDAKLSMTISDDICRCWHFSYLMPFEKLKQKFTTFGHSMEVRQDWLTAVWPSIKHGVRNFHPSDPEAWSDLRQITIPESVEKMFQMLKLPTEC
jgi:GT2 family glycosyltransferase